ncbi:MAG: ATP-binding protein [Cyanobacteria bacterium P01_F01_bin.150]
MSQASPPFRQPILDSYDNILVHLNELIQSYGVLLVLRPADLTIVRASQNSQDYLQISPSDLVGQSLSSFLCEDSRELIMHSQQHLKHRPIYLSLSAILADGPKRFDAHLHRMDESIILELEPGHSLTAMDVTSIQYSVARAIANLRAVSGLKAFLQAAVEEIQVMTDYERVLIYQFDDQHAGSVVAETIVESQSSNQLPSYLGLHFPATDIPKLVRGFYQQGMVRYVPSLSTVSVPLSAAESQNLLDLSHSILRAVDSCCVEYHQNINVEAFFIIALVNNGSLWGLIACHHPTPKSLSVPVRSACETIGQLVAAEVTSKSRDEDLAYLNALKKLQSDFVRSIANATDFKQALIHPQPRLLDLVSATGVAVCLDRDVTLMGQTPNHEDVEALIEWTLSCDAHGSLFHTNCLTKHYADGQAFKDTGSGVLILTISPLRRYLIIWFRPEVIQTVDWAGDPAIAVQAVENEQGEMTLGPRSSFAQWKETVAATSLPWKEVELENALDLKNAIVGIVLNKADKLAQVNLELARSNRELDSFAYAASHDLKEPLRGITNFSNIILRRYADQLDDTGVKRLQTLVRLAQRMDMLIDALLQFSRLGQADLKQTSTDLNKLLQKVIEDLNIGWSDDRLAPLITITKPLPTLDCDAVLISDVFSNLISNAVKYTDQNQARIEIGWLWPNEYKETYLATDSPLLSEPPMAILGDHTEVPILYVKDRGIGIRQRHFQSIFKLFKRLHERDRYGGGSGVGLTITRRIIERHSGHIWVESVYGKGTTFYFTLGYI